jgi:hypothetical protein
MAKIAGSGSESGSISQRHGSVDPDPDPPQNVTDPQHCKKHSDPDSDPKNEHWYIFSNSHLDKKPDVDSETDLNRRGAVTLLTPILGVGPRSKTTV